jgi:hypothetical protein
MNENDGHRYTLNRLTGEIRSLSEADLADFTEADFLTVEADLTAAQAALTAIAMVDREAAGKAFELDLIPVIDPRQIDAAFDGPPQAAERLLSLIVSPDRLEATLGVRGAVPLSGEAAQRTPRALLVLVAGHCHCSPWRAQGGPAGGQVLVRAGLNRLPTGGSRRPLSNELGGISAPHAAHSNQP